MSLTTMTTGRSLATARLLIASHDIPPVSAPSPTIATTADDPEAVPRAKLRSEACLTMPADAPLDVGMRRIEIAGGRHAVLRHRGPYAELERAYSALYKGWLPMSGEEPANLPCYEEYLNDCRALPPAEWLTDICLPLAEKS